MVYDSVVLHLKVSIVWLQVGKINSLDFHRKEDLLVTASEDDSVRLYDIANARLIFVGSTLLKSVSVWLHFSN